MYDYYDDGSDTGNSDSKGASGGAGGSNGGNGSSGTAMAWGSESKWSHGAGGSYGGGKGGSAATYYGSGGGGNSGSGYQGVVFMRAPLNATITIDNTYLYYRLNMTAMKRSSTSYKYFSVAELVMANSSGNISYTNATYSASSSLSGYDVSKAFDGSTSTLWHTNGSPASAWIQVKFPSKVVVTSFTITPRSDQNDRLDAFELLGSNDGSTFYTLYTATNQASGWTRGKAKTFTLP